MAKSEPDKGLGGANAALPENVILELREHHGDRVISYRLLVPFHASDPASIPLVRRITIGVGCESVTIPRDLLNTMLDYFDAKYASING